jgi:NADP-dependent 3-hydroxy acid dehydrogenase YdfG
MLVSLKDQTALVVGASSGIGRATAVLLAREGVRVMAAARREDRLRALESELTAEGRRIVYCAADMSRAEDTERMAALARERFGRIDVLVYAAGTNSPDRSLRRLTPDIWNTILQVSLSGAYHATQAVLPQMRAAGSGYLVYIASISALVPDVSGAAYQAAKRGLLGLAHAVRMEEKENGIRTCVICPGLVDTEMLNLRPVKTPPEVVAKALQAEDVAEAVLAVLRLHPRAVVPEMQVLPTYL